MNWNVLEAAAEKKMLSKKRKFIMPARRAAFKRRVVARRAQRGRKAVFNGELKFHDVDLDDALVATGGTVIASINLIPQGVTEITRIGRKSTIRKIQWRYDIDLPAESDSADISQGDIVRVIMFVDQQTNKATAAVTDILESADYQSFRNLNNSGRFVMLMDVTHSINRRVAFTDGSNTASTPEVVIGTFKFFKDVVIPLEFTAATGAITEITVNNIGVLLISREGTAGFESKIRLRFFDA